MKQFITTGIILSRTDFGEADRIITLITPDHGKLRVLARGVRKVKSKLAGGIELFSVSHITYLPGKGEIGTLVSTRLEKHYGTIAKDIERTMLGYELIKQLNKATEDEPEAAYFDILQQAFEALDDPVIGMDIIQAWFAAQVLRQAGHTPNLQTDTAGQKLDAAQRYDFSFDDMTFTRHPEGNFGADDIKFLRLLFSPNDPKTLAKINNITTLTKHSMPLVNLMKKQYIR